MIDSADVAGPGFINLRIAPAARLEVVRQALRERDCYGTSSEHAGHRVMVEFVSANPTGPLHLGHARQAALGDALANLLGAQGWQVTREFYYNDAGVQIANLALSVQARARELRGEAIEFPEAGYRGEYIVEIAREFLAQGSVTARDGEPVTASGEAEDIDAVRRFAVAYLRNEQDRDLARARRRLRQLLPRIVAVPGRQGRSRGRRDGEVGHDVRRRRRAVAEDD